MEKEPTELQTAQQVSSQKDIEKNKKIFQSQIQVMRRLFRPHKNPYSLVDWHMRRSNLDLPLFAAFGLVNPLEYDYFSHHIDRWHQRIEDETMDKAIPSPMATDDDDDDEMEETEEQPNIRTSIIILPARHVHVFLQSLAREDYDQHENLCLRFDKPVQLIRAVYNALHLEGNRQDPNEGMSAVDELLCQKAYPASEIGAWQLMNKMVAGNSRSPLKMQLKRTSKALKELNEFQLYKAVADICDYAQNPVGVQRIEGQQQSYVFSERSPRIRASLDFLQKKGFLNEKALAQVQTMSDKERSERVLQLKQNAVASFLFDMERSAPDALWLQQMRTAFDACFHKILETVGRPVLIAPKTKNIVCQIPKTANATAKSTQTGVAPQSENTVKATIKSAQAMSASQSENAAKTTAKSTQAVAAPQAENSGKLGKRDGQSWLPQMLKTWFIRRRD